eukprot:403344526
MESTNQPGPEAENHTTIDTTVPAAPSFTDISTVRYLSCEISKLMPLITDDLGNHETNLYLNAAVQFAQQSKDSARNGDFANSIHLAEKAVKRIERLCSIRIETQPDFLILKAPFYYLMGNAIITYVENASDVFGNVPQIPDAEDSEAESEEEAEVEGEEEDGQEEQKDQSVDKNSSAATPAKQDDEPRIEEEVKQQEQINTASDPLQDHKDPEDYGGQLCDDAYENIEIGIQIIEDFLNSPNCIEAMRDQRKEVIMDLLIDSFNRQAELFQFKEQFEQAVVCFEKVVELCQSQKNLDYNNMRLLSASLYNIGYCHQLTQKNDEAKAAYEKAQGVMKTHIISEVKSQGGGQNLDYENSTVQQLSQPSIFDTDRIKELKSLLIEISAKLQETAEDKQIKEKIDEIKKSEGEDVKVDEKFGKPQENAEKFQDMTAKIRIGKKRTHEDMTSTNTNNTDPKLEQTNNKQLKTNETTSLGVSEKTSGSDKENSQNVTS